MREMIGKYKILKLLGEGATGPVYLAADPFSERDLAIKAGLDDFSPGCCARFNEAFLSIMAERISMLCWRLLHALHSQKISMV